MCGVASLSKYLPQEGGIEHMMDINMARISPAYRGSAVDSGSRPKVEGCARGPASTIPALV